MSEIEEELEKSAVEAALRTWTQLLEGIFQIQHDVNSFLDSSKNPTIMKGGMLPPAGVKQILEKKEGLFRKHMMVGLKVGSAHVRAELITPTYHRENVSTSRLVPSSLPISILRRMRSVCLLSLPGSSRSLSP